MIPNGIAIEPFMAPPKNDFRKEWGLPQRAVVAIFIGRLSEEKRVLVLLQAFRRAWCASGVDAYLVCIGTGPQKEVLERRAREWGLEGRVLLPGVYPNERIPDCLKAADFFVSASVSEVHPITFLEAAAAGLPLLGYDSPGVSEIIEPGINGLLARDEGELVRQMVRLFSEAPLRERLATGARLTGQRYSIRRTTSRFLALYEALLHQR